MPSDKAGRVVFIGNVPYGGTEETVKPVLERVGQVIDFRLVHDKETGRPKGFGFAEYADADAAASAVRNLNDHDFMGRKLRVDWSNDNGAGDAEPHNYSAPPPPTNGRPEASSALQSSALPPLPPGVDLQPNLTCPDAISRTLSTLPTPQLLDILSQMKGLVMTDPAKATELLRQAPQLAYAIFQALLLLNLVDTAMLGHLIEPGAGPAPVAAPPQQPPQPPPAAQPSRNYPNYPPQQVPTPQPLAQPPAPQYAQPPPAQAPPAAADPNQQLYGMIMQLSPAQIDQLPPDQRSQVIAIRQQFMAAAGR